MNADRGEVQVGWSAHARDGDKIGEVEEVGHNYLLVKRGLIVTTELYIPLSAVAAIDASAGRIHLNVERGEIEGMGWHEPPAADPVAAGAVDGLGYTGRDAYGRPEAVGPEQTTEGLGYTGAATPDDDAGSRSEDWRGAERGPSRHGAAVEDEGGGVLAGAAASIDPTRDTSDAQAAGVRAARVDWPDTTETDPDDGIRGR